MLQQKKGNALHLRYALDNKQTKAVGKKIVISKQVKSKIFKNLSEFPIQMPSEYKQNEPSNHINRPHSSFMNYETIIPKPNRPEPTLNQYKQGNKKRLSLDSNKKPQRDSLISRGQINKKMSKNGKNIDDAIKLKLNEERRRYNLSCNSMVEDNRGESKTKNKGSIKNKRHSINNLHLNKNIRQKEGKQNNRDLKQIKNIIIKDIKIERSKSKSKSKNKIKKSVPNLDKSTTVGIGFGLVHNDKNLFKKKQSTSTAFMNAPAKKKKKCKKVERTMKLQRIPDQLSQQEQYPINKYEQKNIKNERNNSRSLKIKSKSRKGSASKQKSKKKNSQLQIDYASCVNLPSGSSGIILSSNLSYRNNSKQNLQTLKIVDDWHKNNSINYVESNSSLDISQIRFYQNNRSQFNENSSKDNERMQIAKPKSYHQRQSIEMQILEEYPEFDSIELAFLSSVIFIQRKWREFHLYKNIFKNMSFIGEKSFIHQRQYHLNVQKSNSKSPSKNQQRSIQKSSRHMTETKINSLPTMTADQKQSFEKEVKEQLNSEFSSQKNKSKQMQDDDKKLIEGWKRLKNKVYLEQNQEELVSRKDKKNYSFFNLEQNLSIHNSNKMNQQIKQQLSPLSELCLSNRNYQFLQNQIFPNITYLLIKKQQLREDLIRKMQQLNILIKSNHILQDEYIKIKKKYQDEYNRNIKELSKSKKDIKKGYLKFIDSYKCIKHEALRRVSSQLGLMSIMYKKIYNFDQVIEEGSDSSQSLKKLTKKILIRKEFYHTQKLEPYLLSNQSFLVDPFFSSEKVQKQINSNRESKQASIKSFRSKKQKFRDDQSGLKKELFIQIQQSRQASRQQIQRNFEKKKKILEENSSQSKVISSLIHEKKPKSDFSESKQFKFTTEAQQIDKKKEDTILELIIIQLTRQLFQQLIDIDESKEKIIESQEQQLKQKDDDHEIQDFEVIQQIKSIQLEDYDSKSKLEDAEIIQNEKYSEIYLIDGAKQKKDVQSHRKHRNSSKYNFSPESEQKVLVETDEIIVYALQLFDFLKNNELTEEIIYKLNKNHGFSPLEYLRFLRDFQIPDEQYEPIISNQTFIDWEETFASTHSPIYSNQKQLYLKQQFSTIFHRCIFETIICLFEEYRPFGQKGMPFPWQKTAYFCRYIDMPKLYQIFTDCIKKLENLIKYGSGIIEQKYLICGEQDLERLHEQNEDKIIDMLQDELKVSPHNWYEVEQHCLEIKLQIQNQIYEYLLLEALDEFLQEV